MNGDSRGRVQAEEASEPPNQPAECVGRVAGGVMPAPEATVCGATGDDGVALDPLPVTAWDASLDHVVADMKGAPINVHKLMAHNPALLRAWWSFRNHSVEGGTLGPRRGELIILRVGVNLGAWYEWASHVDRALKCGLSIHEINQVLERDVSTGWSESEAVLLGAVDELVASHSLSDTTRQRMAEHFTAAQILDLIAIHGMYVILGCMIRSWGLPLDAVVAERISAHADRAAFEAAAERFRAETATGTEPRT